ncbi:hypothetical protein GBAR_LOCUS14778, partial [Geodia barretti]
YSCGSFPLPVLVGPLIGGCTLRLGYSTTALGPRRLPGREKHPSLPEPPQDPAAATLIHNSTVFEYTPSRQFSAFARLIKTPADFETISGYSAVPLLLLTTLPSLWRQIDLSNAADCSFCLLFGAALFSLYWPLQTDILFNNT